MPAVVLVGEGDQLGRPRRQRDRPLEVAQEPEPLGGAADDEAGIACDLALERGERLGGRAVVADHADPAGPGLGADRVELRGEPGRVGLVRRHADGDQRLGGGGRIGRRFGLALLGGRERDRAEREGPLGAVAGDEQLQLARSGLDRPLDLHQRPPEPAGAVASLRRHRIGVDRLEAVADPQPHPLDDARGLDLALQVERRSRADPDRVGRRGREPCEAIGVLDLRAVHSGCWGHCRAYRRGPPPGPR